MDISTEAVTRLTRDRKTNYLIRPVWSLDSRRVAIGELDGGIVEVAVDSGKSVPLAPKPLFARSWTPDGRSLIVSHGYTSRISSLTPGPDAKPSLIAETPYSMRAITLSPDGRTVAYISDESGEFDAYIASFPTFGEKRKVSAGGATHLIWNRSGKELFLANREGSILSAEINTSAGLSAGVPKMIVPVQSNLVDSRFPFAVTPDGQRFLIPESLGQNLAPEGFRVVVNWAAELK